MELTFTALQYIVAVAQTKSISKAAKNFYMSQPHLSNVIRSVERQLGVTLFYRSPKGMELTEAGRNFIQRVQPILEQVNSLEASMQTDPTERVRVNLSLTRSYQVLRVVTEIVNANSNKKLFEMSIRETGPFQVIEDVRSGAAQMGILHFYSSQESYFFHCLRVFGLAYHSRYRRPFLLAMSTENPLARVPRITSEMLLNQIIVLYGDYESEIAPYRFCNSEDYISSKRIYVYDRATAMDLLSRCPNTYTLITGLHPTTLSQYGLVLRQCKDLELYNIGCCIHMENMEFNPLLREIRKKILEIDWTERVVD